MERIDGKEARTLEPLLLLASLDHISVLFPYGSMFLCVVTMHFSSRGIYRYVLFSGRLVEDDRLGRISLCICFLCGVRQYVGVVLDSPSFHRDLVLEDQEDHWQVLQDGPLKGILFVYLSGHAVLLKHMYRGGCCKKVPLRCSQQGNRFNWLGSVAVKPSACSELLSRLQTFCTVFNTESFWLPSVILPY